MSKSMTIGANKNIEEKTYDMCHPAISLSFYIKTSITVSEVFIEPI